MWAKQMNRWILAGALSLSVAGMAWAAPKEEAKSTGKSAEKAAAAQATDKAKGAGADAAAKADKAAGAKLSGTYAAYAKDAELPEETKAKLAEVATARAEAVNKWEQENAAKLEDARKRAAAAKESGDKEAAKKAREDISALNASRRTVEDEYDAKMQAQLTPEQQVKWQRAGLYQYTLRRFKEVTLTDAQKEQIKTLAQKSAEEVQKLPNKSDANVKPIRTKLVADAEAQVLTAEQKAALSAGKTKKPDVPAEKAD
jgi:Spy/CpxP family protein refolding chaperone